MNDMEYAKRMLIKAMREIPPDGAAEAEWIKGLLINGEKIMTGSGDIKDIVLSTICRYTGQQDIYKNDLWENDIVELYEKPKEFWKIVFGKFDVIDKGTECKANEAIGWYIYKMPKGITEKRSPCYPLTPEMINEMKIIRNGDAYIRFARENDGVWLR